MGTRVVPRGERQTMVFHNVTSDASTHELFRLYSGREGTVGVDIFIIGDMIEHNKLTRDLEEAPDLFTIYFSDCKFDPKNLSADERECNTYRECTHAIPNNARMARV